MAPYKIITLLILFSSFLASCTSALIEPESPEIVEPTPSQTPSPGAKVSQPTQAKGLADYEFPDRPDPDQRYLFYLHGKIIEDQGLPAISPDFGEYEYEAILEALSSSGYFVISEQRLKDTNAVAYARKISEQISVLLEAGVPPENITVVGASKGAAIAIYVSHFQENEELNYAILAICHPDYIDILLRDKISLKGNVLSIFDSVDEFAGSCQELFSFSEGKGIERYEEIVLDIGTGHGILYQPMEEWILPVIQWVDTK